MPVVSRRLRRKQEKTDKRKKKKASAKSSTCLTQRKSKTLRKEKPICHSIEPAEKQRKLNNQPKKN